MTDLPPPVRRRGMSTSTKIVLLVVTAAVVYGVWSFTQGVKNLGKAVREGAVEAGKVAKETAQDMMVILHGGYKTQPRFAKVMAELSGHPKVIAALGTPIVEQGLYNYESSADGIVVKYTYGVTLSGPNGKGKGDVVISESEGRSVVEAASFTGADGKAIDLMVAD